jgi:5-methyltetrahydrofolate--homocysteine methyltransferase
VQSNLDRLLAQRILILDGAMGTMIQQLGFGEGEFRGSQFAGHGRDLTGCNDLLSVTQPEAIVAIHGDYLHAGADILCTNSFNANRISLADYDLADHVREINLAAAACARRAVTRFGKARGDSLFVAGSLGPTNRTASMSPRVSDPGYRAVSFDDLAAAYAEQIAALVEGGVDVLLAETVFDTLNLKACLFAAEEYFQRQGVRVPMMVSVTITDRSGRTLSGQTLEAFCISIAHARLLSVGINCALGAELMRPYVEELSGLVETATSCHPNAGLPNEFGSYDETPAETARVLREFAANGWLNIVGGCCGTTPAHIRAIATAVADLPPRQPPKLECYARYSGLEPLVLRPESNFTLIGERTNVCGSRRFARLVREGHLEDAVAVARQQVEGGANVIDVNMDEALLDGPAMMTRFLHLIAAEPDIARVPVMVDSSSWAVLEAGLKCLQGKGIVNSISLKEGEARFLQQATLVRRYGAACVVMMFDEQGQATTTEHRVRIARRAYRLLTESVGMPPSDIIFDPNILAIGTGMEEHNGYAVSFLEATRQIKRLFPQVKISGGVSNVSFSFRSSEALRRAMHSAFLYHAIRAGLDMAIVNAGQLDVYEEIPPELRGLVEDVLLDRRGDATERLIAFAQSPIAAQAKSDGNALAWRNAPVDQRLSHALIQGITDYIAEDLEEARGGYPTGLAIIEGPLMAGMQIVGDLFGQGKMFLPQVVKSARVMKKAVACLMPWMDQQRAAASAAGSHRGKIVMATVKGDVHDIGKNIVGIVLGCNNYQVIDLGVMVPCETILKTVIESGADMVGLSGLITPSLEEMAHVARELERRGMTVPLLIGGATTSAKHTAVKIAPAYRQPTVHVIDASRSVGLVERLMQPQSRERLDQENRAEQARLTAAYHKRQQIKLVPYAEARAKRFATDWATAAVDEPEFLGTRALQDFPLEKLVEYIDWSPFFSVWELRGKYPQICDDPLQGAEARRLFADARTLLDRIVAEKLLTAQGVYGFWPAASEGDDIIVYHDRDRVRELARLHTLRQQWERKGQTHYCALADFIAPADSGRADYLGGFAVTAGHGCAELVARCQADHDDYTAIMAQALADRLAEAFAECLHQQARRDWGYGRQEQLPPEALIREQYRGIRPAPGYPACPDHSEKETLFRLLDAEQATGIRLTESYAMSPAAAVCGMYFAHPRAHYFAVDRITRDQVESYARRKGIPIREVERWLASNLSYDPEP